MTASLTCPRCNAVVTAHDEDELVAHVQAHVRDAHNAAHSPSREHILARLHGRDPKGDSHRHR
jgi:predicted small metal-binding protein